MKLYNIITALKITRVENQNRIKIILLSLSILHVLHVSVEKIIAKFKIMVKVKLKHKYIYILMKKTYVFFFRFIH